MLLLRSYEIGPGIATLAHRFPNQMTEVIQIYASGSPNLKKNQQSTIAYFNSCIVEEAIVQ